MNTCKNCKEALYALLDEYLEIRNGCCRDLNKHLEQLFLECEHGDAEHRKWLKDKFNDYAKRQNNE